jgi:hypothetical protein
VMLDGASAQQGANGALGVRHGESQRPRQILSVRGSRLPRS